MTIRVCVCRPQHMSGMCHFQTLNKKHNFFVFSDLRVLHKCSGGMSGP